MVLNAMIFREIKYADHPFITYNYLNTMKTIHNLLIVAIILMLSNNNSFSQVEQSRYNAEWSTEFSCDGVFKDFIWGTASFTEIKYYDRQGNLIWNKLILIGSNFDSQSGEIFKVTYLANEEDYNPGSTLTKKFIYNLTGNRGTKYRCLVIYEIDNEENWNLIYKNEECL
jgi:hypothetical protein